MRDREAAGGHVQEHVVEGDHLGQWRREVWRPDKQPRAHHVALGDRAVLVAHLERRRDRTIPDVVEPTIIVGVVVNTSRPLGRGRSAFPWDHDQPSGVVRAQFPQRRDRRGLGKIRPTFLVGCR